MNDELSHTRTPIVASGHEHNLQYIKQDNIRYIVSGAGSKKSAVGMGEGSIFAAAKKGYVKLEYHLNFLEILYIIPDADGTKAEVIFRDRVSLN